MSEARIKLAPETVAYADSETRKLVVEFAIPGAPTDGDGGSNSALSRATQASGVVGARVGSSRCVGPAPAGQGDIGPP